MAPKSLNRVSNTTQPSTTSQQQQQQQPQQKPLPNTQSITDRLQKYNSTIGHGAHTAENDEKLLFTKLFSIRSAHLPGNNWCQDWIQWMQNNHPVLGLCGSDGEEFGEEEFFVVFGGVCSVTDCG